MTEEPKYRTFDPFDHLHATLTAAAKSGEAMKVKAYTASIPQPVIGVQQFIIETMRQREAGDYVFIVCVTETGQAIRLVLPPEAADAIARQREALTTKGRRQRGIDQARARQAR